MLSADEIARLLDLEPHPEGGLFRETFRDTATVAVGCTVAPGFQFAGFELAPPQFEPESGAGA
jgi:predicted cupin superfamily sugar epimerase